MRQKLLFLLVALLLISTMIGGCTSMQSSTVIKPKVEKYPNKPLTTFVSFSAGTGADMLARTLEKTSFQLLGQPLVIVNKPGGSGTLGWNELVSAKPDGYTMGITSIELLLLPIYGSTKYDYPTALEPLAQMAVTPYVIAVQNNSSWKNLDSLINYAKQHPKQLKYGHAGIGTVGHVVGEIFAKNADITLEQVPFNGSSEALTALLGGHVQMIFVNPALVKEHVKNGTIKVLAVSSEQRLTDSLFAQVPTFQECGFNIVLSNRFGVAVPKETPREIKTTLAEGLRKIITDPEFKKSIENMGLQFEYLDSKESAERWLIDSQKLTESVQITGIVDLIKSQKQ